MDLLLAWDHAVFRWFNPDLGHPFVEGLMSFLSTNPFFWPATVLLAVGLIWKGGTRGLVFILMLAAAAGLANESVTEPLKAWIHRPRPYIIFSDVCLRVGKGSSNASMPSGHAMHAALIATVAGWYYPRALWVVVPLALGVAISRIYVGVHFPSDVVVGLILGVGFAGLFLVAADRLWRTWGPRVWSRAARRVPSLLRPESAPPIATERDKGCH